MTDTTFELINQLADERNFLYRLAAKQHLTETQLGRIHEIEGRLAMLWDTHRRELVASRRPERYTDAIRRAA
ncbi:MAG: hypothetical protein LCI00_09725 [Chloroflexi bacterium]|nr:hypothetical protein [Chloroflexota bacterium]MCC6892995.1 hypothetical protein [Anaerolineae bacterium]